jgi:hypothetical protein
MVLIIFDVIMRPTPLLLLLLLRLRTIHVFLVLPVKNNYYISELIFFIILIVLFFIAIEATFLFIIRCRCSLVVRSLLKHLLLLLFLFFSFFVRHCGNSLVLFFVTLLPLWQQYYSRRFVPINKPQDLIFIVVIYFVCVSTLYKLS